MAASSMTDVLKQIRDRVLARIPQTFMNDWDRDRFDGSQIVLFERDLRLWHSATLDPSITEGGVFSCESSEYSRMLRFQFDSGPLPFRGSWSITALFCTEEISLEELLGSSSNKPRLDLVFDKLPQPFLDSYLKSWNAFQWQQEPFRRKFAERPYFEQVSPYFEQVSSSITTRGLFDKKKANPVLIIPPTRTRLIDLE